MSKNRGQTSARSQKRMSKQTRVFNNKPNRKNNINTLLRKRYLKYLENE